MYMEVIRFRSTGQSKVTKQHNHLNRKNIKQNKKYKCKYNIKYIYLTFIYCTCKFKMHKKSFFIENYELTFPSKNHKQSNAHEKHKQYFPAKGANKQITEIN